MMENKICFYFQHMDLDLDTPVINYTVSRLPTYFLFMHLHCHGAGNDLNFLIHVFLFHLILKAVSQCVL